MESNTKAMDVISDVGRELCFASTDAFALYLDLDGELLCIKNDEFVLDCLRTIPASLKSASTETRAVVGAFFPVIFV